MQNGFFIMCRSSVQGCISIATTLQEDYWEEDLSDAETEPGDIRSDTLQGVPGGAPSGGPLSGTRMLEECTLDADGLGYIEFQAENLESLGKSFTVLHVWILCSFVVFCVLGSKRCRMCTVR